MKIVSLGMGTGQMEIDLLQRIATYKRRPSVVNIVGIEISHESVQIAERDIHALSASLPFEVNTL